MTVKPESILRSYITVGVLILLVYLVTFVWSLDILSAASPHPIGEERTPAYAGIYIVLQLAMIGITWNTAALPIIFFSQYYPFEDMPSLIEKASVVVCHVLYWGGFLLFLKRLKRMKIACLAASYLVLVLVLSVSVKGCVHTQLPRPPKALPQPHNLITLTGENEHLERLQITGHKNEYSSFEYSVSPDNQWIVYMVTAVKASDRAVLLRTANLRNGSSFSFELPKSQRDRRRTDLDERYVMFNIDHDGWTRDSRLFFVRDKSLDPRYWPLAALEKARPPAGYVIDYSDQASPRLIANSLLDEKTRHTEDKKERLTCSDCPIISYLDHKLEPHLGDPFYTRKGSYRVSLYEKGMKERKLATIRGDSPAFSSLSLSPNRRYLVFVESHVRTGEWSLRTDSRPLNLVDMLTGKRYLVAGSGSSPHWDSKSERLFFLDDRTLNAVEISQALKYPR